MKTVYRMMAVCLMCAVVAGPGYGANSWLDQGKKLLDSVQGSDSGSSSDSTASDLTLQEITAGLKQALKKGADAVVQRLGTVNGFNADSHVHIPLPENLSTAKSLLDKAGLGAYTDEVELRLNRAAEAAVPKARDLFVEAISQMRMEDARAILDGPDDAATRYFRDKMSPGLIEEMSPVINDSLDAVGAVRAYDEMMARYKQLPFVPDVKGDLTAYTAGKTVDGIFFYLAREEKAIRENPAKRTTELLQKVFN